MPYKVIGNKFMAMKIDQKARIVFWGYVGLVQTRSLRTWGSTTPPLTSYSGKQGAS
jgi:hypothetical protein